MIYVVTAVHNRYSITEKFVKQLKEQTYQKIHLVLIDDGSTDGTADMVRYNLESATIIRGNGKLWWGGALHKAYKWICVNYVNENDFVLISNDDVDLPNDYVEKAIGKFHNQKKVLISGIGVSVDNEKKILDIPLVWDHKYFCGLPIKDYNQFSNCVSTRSLFMRVKDLIDIGGFHPQLLPHYTSDYEWTMRAVKKGYIIKAYKDITYCFDQTTTGFRNIKKMTIKQIFSKKSNANPFYRISFMFMVTPVTMIPSAIWAQIRRIKYK